MNPFNGLWVPLVTPFTQQATIDLPAAQRLTNWLIEQGVDGLVVCGTTGEAATLSDVEQQTLLNAVVEATDHRCPVLFGLTGNDTLQLTRRLREFDTRNAHQLTGYLISAPYYVRPSQAGIQQHFESVASATTLPIVIYNIPYRTGINIEIPTLQALSKNPQFCAVKESGGGNLDQLTRLIRETPLQVLSGEDSLIFINGCLGGHGAISAAAHLRPDLYQRMLTHLRQGNLSAARQIDQVLQPIIKALFSEPNPAPLKAALASRGLIENILRLPMSTASAGCSAALETLLDPLFAIP